MPKVEEEKAWGFCFDDDDFLIERVFGVPLLDVDNDIEGEKEVFLTFLLKPILLLLPSISVPSFLFFSSNLLSSSFSINLS